MMKNKIIECAKRFDADIIAKKPVYAEDSNLGVTINPESDNTLLATVLNYSDKDIVPEIEIRHGYKIKEILYGSLDNIPACDGVIMRLEKKEKNKYQF